MRSTALPPDQKPTVYRGLGALIGGALVVLFCVGGAVDLLAEDGGGGLLGAAILFLVAVLAFAYGVYPAAFSHPDRLEVRNPMRLITLPWSSVTNLTARLSFVVHTERTRFTVWSIPVSLRERRRLERTRLRELSRQQREIVRARRNAGTSAYGLDEGRSRRGGVESIERLSFADQAVSEMQERITHWREYDRAAGGPAAEARQPTVRPSLPTLVPLAAGVVFLIVALIVR